MGPVLREKDRLNARETGLSALHQLILSQGKYQTQKTHRLQTQSPRLVWHRDYTDFSEEGECCLPGRISIGADGPSVPRTHCQRGDSVVLAASEANCRLSMALSCYNLESQYCAHI